MHVGHIDGQLRIRTNYKNYKSFYNTFNSNKSLHHNQYSL